MSEYTTLSNYCEGSDDDELEDSELEIIRNYKPLDKKRNHNKSSMEESEYEEDDDSFNDDNDDSKIEDGLLTEPLTSQERTLYNYWY